MAAECGIHECQVGHNMRSAEPHGRRSPPRDPRDRAKPLNQTTTNMGRFRRVAITLTQGLVDASGLQM